MYFYFVVTWYCVGLFPVGLANLESLNLSFTVVEDVGLRKLSGLSSLKSLNLDVRQITDTGLAALTSKYYGHCVQMGTEWNYKNQLK